MCGAGAEPRGTHQTSYGRIELKDLYYRMSQPYIQTQSNAAAQDQQPQQLIEVPFTLNLRDINLNLNYL